MKHSVLCCCTVAARLVASGQVYCYGQRLPITGYPLRAPVSSSRLSETRQRDEVLSDSTLSQSPSRGEYRTESPVASSERDSVEADDSDNDDDFSLAPDGATWCKDVAMAACSAGSRRLDDSEPCVADWLKLSDTVEPSCCDSPPLRRCETLPDDDADEELDTDEDCRLSDDDGGDDGVDIGDIVICSERAVLERGNTISQSRSEQLQRSAERTQKLQFSEEKLCLIDKMIRAGSVDFPGKVRVIMAENAVELVAADENVRESETKLYELVVNFGSSSLQLRAGVVKLLLSSRGQQWLRTQLASLDAVFHVKDGECPCVVGADGETSTAAKLLLESALSSRKIPFDDQHATFLRSVQWAGAVDRFESEFFVAVSTQYRDKEIVVEGSVEALSDIGKTVETMLRQNSRVQRNIVMSAAQFQLLMHFRVEIHDKLKSVTSRQQDRCAVYIL